MRLLRRLGANARYFTDQSTNIPLDVSSGDAAVGMCIDFYGRFQAEAAAAAGRPGPRGLRHRPRRASIDPDPIALPLRGRPTSSSPIRFIEFVLSEDRPEALELQPRDARVGPERYRLRRLPILPRL